MITVRAPARHARPGLSARDVCKESEIEPPPWRRPPRRARPRLGWAEPAAARPKRTASSDCCGAVRPSPPHGAPRAPCAGRCPSPRRAGRVGCQLAVPRFSGVEWSYRLGISAVCDLHGGKGHQARYEPSDSAHRDQAARRHSWTRPPHTPTRCTGDSTVPGSTSISRGAGRGGRKSTLLYGQTRSRIRRRRAVLSAPTVWAEPCHLTMSLGSAS